MKRSYQIYEDDQYDHLTPPASPVCEHLRVLADYSMQEMRSSTCNCGRTVFDSMDRCSVCAQNRQKRMSQHSYVLPERPAKQLTPPPSQPASPRRSYDSVAPVLSRIPSAREVFTNAFSAEGGSKDFFPSSMYRRPTRPDADSRRTSEASSILSSGANTPTMSESRDGGRKQSRSATPDARVLESGYAPMAAGFARLSRKNQSEYGTSPFDQALRGRASSARPSLDLSARMFSGPA